jgi:hypothetical protein
MRLPFAYGFLHVEIELLVGLGSKGLRFVCFFDKRRCRLQATALSAHPEEI